MTPLEQFKKEYEIAEQELKGIVDFKRLEKWIKENVGKRCKEYAAGCYVCDVWHGYDALQSLLSDKL